MTAKAPKRARKTSKTGGEKRAEKVTGASGAKGTTSVHTSQTKRPPRGTRAKNVALPTAPRTADDDAPQQFASDEAWRRWLEANHSTATGVWIQLMKKSSGIASTAYPATLDIALCYGWIDAKRRTLDAASFLQRFTPRGARSTWSKINVAKAESLIAEGRMQPAGLSEVERAKKDGRWDAAYAPQSQIAVPDDLAQALARKPKAKAHFDSLNSRNRFAVLFRVHMAKKPETRARRIAQFVEMLLRGEKIYP